MKKCYRCKEKKELNEFHKNVKHYDGLSTACKPCTNKERQAAPSYSSNLRLKALAVLGGMCIRCGFSDPRALQIDHIKGGGRQERISEVSNKVKSLYRRIADGALEDFVLEYQVLCANCNSIKRIENREHGRYQNGQYAFGQ